MLLVISVGFGFLAVSLVLLGVTMILEERGLRGRLNLLTTGQLTDSLMEVHLDGTAKPAPLRVARPLAQALAPLVSPNLRKRARLKLASAGLLGMMDELDFILIRLASWIGGSCVGLFFYQLLVHKNPRNALFAGGLLSLTGAILPDQRVQGQIDLRQRRIRKTLPDVIDLLVVSIEAGTGFDAAMLRVKDKFTGPIAEEIDRALREMQLGKTRVDALRSMAHRANVEELTLFISAVCQAEQLGASMAQVLRSQTSTIRQKRMFKIREQAQKLQVKILFPLVFFIFPALFVVLLGPAAMQIYKVFSNR